MPGDDDVLRWKQSKSKTEKQAGMPSPEPKRKKWAERTHANRRTAGSLQTPISESRGTVEGLTSAGTKSIFDRSLAEPNGRATRPLDWLGQRQAQGTGDRETKQTQYAAVKKEHQCHCYIYVVLRLAVFSCQHVPSPRPPTGWAEGHRAVNRLPVCKPTPNPPSPVLPNVAGRCSGSRAYNHRH